MRSKTIQDRVLILIWPPGTGKTSTLVHQAHGLTAIGHRLLFGAQSNVAVDTMATAFWEKLPSYLKGKKFLRLETSAAERKNIVRSDDYLASNLDVDKLYSAPTAGESTSYQEDPEYIHWFNKAMEAAVDFETGQDVFKRFKAREESFKKAYEHMEQLGEEASSAVPEGMTLRYRIAELVEQDRVAAVAAHAHEQAKHTGMDLVQWDKDHSVDQYDKSFEYKRHIQYFKARQGRLDFRERRAFDRIWYAQEIRVIRASDGIFVSLNNSGRKIMKEGFDPSVLIIDEGGQALISTFCIPLTAFKNWQAVLLYGDQKQLEPMNAAFSGNEFVNNAKVSPLSLLVSKGVPHIMLEICYRMCPAIIQWPSQYFYHGKLRCDALVQQDNSVRQAMRWISEEHYRIKGGSEYWFVDVVHGISRPEPNGTSLQNYANADAISQAVAYMIDAQILAENITILTIYKGQRLISVSKVELRHQDALVNAAPDAQVPSFKIKAVATVDSYQGQESEVVILDLVTAFDKSPL